MISSADLRLLADAIVQAIPAPDRILTMEDAGKMLGRPPKEIVKMCKEGVIPAHKFPGGKIWYISQNELQKALFAGNK